MNARPKLPIYPSEDTTVGQTWIPGQHPAIEDEMLTCDDRKEQNKIGDVLREGRLRPRSHRQPGATAPPAWR